jgi:eukaryotic-like serine/threonine-protein kinase
MGQVYKAHDPRLGRDVAIKVSHQDFTDRFSREARTIAALNHTNICHLYDVGPNYLVMELVEGESLSDLIKAGMTLKDATPIIAQLIDGIEAAHEKNITHRDLKPANIKITPDGVVKILDFGLAKVGRDPEPSGRLDPENSPTMSMEATAAGTILGTAAYMAPEQAKGKQADRRADIWAFGVIVYEMLTGQRLFAGESAVEILTGVLHKEPDFSAAPLQVQPLLRWCLQKERKDRLQSIGDARILLSREIAEPAPAATVDARTAPAKSNRSKLAWIVAAVGILAAAGSMGWMLTGPQRVPEIVRFEIHAPPGSKLPLGTPAISNDGKMIAYTVAGADDISHLHVRSLDSTESRELPGTEKAVHPFWSPDGRSLAFASGVELKRIEISAGQPHKLAGIFGPWHGSWNSEGLILFPSRFAFETIPAQGGQVQERLHLDPKHGEVGMGFGEFLPDGKHYLLRVAHSDDRSSIEMASLDSQNVTS